MAKSTTVSLVLLIILVMTILNGTEAAQRGVLHHQLDTAEEERLILFCLHEFKYSNCFKDIWLCYKCYWILTYLDLPPPPPPRTHKIL
jgi:hypothetical protein